MNKFVKFLKPYKVASHKVWEVENRSSILKLDWNEATIEPSPLVCKAVSNAVEEGTFRYYPDVYNIRLLEKLAKYVDIPFENIQYFPSSDVSHEYIIRSLINENDKVLMIGPTYDNFRTTCESNGGKVEFWLLKENKYFDEEEFSSILKRQNPKIAYICNPNNPTGSTIDLEIIENLVSNHRETYFVIDEAYYEFYGLSCKDLVLKYENVIVTRTFSKAFALAGMRIGYIIAPIKILDQVNKIRNAKNVQHLSQVAALAALDDIRYTNNYVQEVNESKLQFAKDIEELDLGITDVFVGAGNFVLFNVNSIEVKSKLIEYLENHNIFVRNLTHMDVVKYSVRITIGTKAQMKKVVDVLKDFHA